MRLLLIRHGQTPSNVSGALDTGRPGALLTPLGQRQAAAVPGALAGEPVAAVYASALTRTQLTGAPLARARGLEVRVVEGIEEIEAGALEMAADPASIEAYVGTVAAWAVGDLDRIMPGSTDGHAFLARYDAALAAVGAAHEPDATVAVISHGAAIRSYALMRAGGGSPSADFSALRVHNTGMVILDGSVGGGWRVERWQTEPIGGVDLDVGTGRDATGDGAPTPAAGWPGSMPA